MVSSACACADNWRIEACDLRTGTVRAILHPLAFDFQTNLNRVGQGTLTLATKALKVRDIWPHLTSIYITRISGGTATPLAPVVEFAGLVESFSASDGGTTSVGLQSIENYLHHRMLRTRKRFVNAPQTSIAKNLVDYAGTNGIPLRAVADGSAFARDRTYESWDRKIIGEAIEELANVINGLDWELTHAKDSMGRWTTTMIFRDYVGEDRGIILQSDREAQGYGLDVDAAEHATLVDAIGQGEEEDQLITTSIDTSGIYPQFDAAPAWQDVSEEATLQEYGDGYLEDYQEPVALPNVTVRGMSPDPRMVRLGDTVEVRTDFGAVTFRGKARITSLSWALGLDEPETRTFDMLPITRASSSVLNQVPTDTNCEEC